MNRRELMKMMAAGAAAPIAGDLTPDNAKTYSVAVQNAGYSSRFPATQVASRDFALRDMAITAVSLKSSALK